MTDLHSNGNFYSTPDFPPEQEAAFREALEVICALLAKKHR